MQTYGLNNPTFASSSQKGHSPGLAADGDEESYWQPAAEENSAYWILDTERGLWLHTITARFAEKVNCRFKIEISADKETWQLVGDYSTTTGEKQDVRLSFEQPLKMRFVRFSFSMDEGSIWPRLAEVRVQGRVAD